MNTDTGEIYRTEQSIREALERGEPLVEVTEHDDGSVEIGPVLSRAERRAQQFPRNERRLTTGPRSRA